jgi:hypothetical protein
MRKLWYYKFYYTGNQYKDLTSVYIEAQSMQEADHILFKQHPNIDLANNFSREEYVSMK